MREGTFLSSHSFSRRTRCRPAKAVLWSCSWIRSQKPSDVFRCCAHHVSILCSRSCVRLQRGSVKSLGSSSECEPLKPFIQILQAVRRSRGAIWGSGAPVNREQSLGLYVALPCLSTSAPVSEIGKEVTQHAPPNRFLLDSGCKGCRPVQGSIPIRAPQKR